MARMHSRSKGVSESTLPYNKVRPYWATQTKEEIINAILNLSRKGHKPSEIGKIMRDEYAVGQVKSMTDKNILKILKENNLAPTIPEDLSALLRKCVSILNHLNTFKNDKNARYRLNLIESRMHRLARYYKRKEVIPAEWKPYTITRT
jgi:small subunit ribosomal protein S13e